MKKVLGIVPTAKDMTLIALEGNADSQKYVTLEKEVFKFVPTDDQTKFLSNTYNFVSTLIKEEKITEIEILKAGTSPSGKGASPGRVKAEAAIQLAASNANVPVNLVAPQSIAAAKKRAEKASEKPIDEQVNHKFSSETKRDAATLALLNIKKG